MLSIRPALVSVFSRAKRWFAALLAVALGGGVQGQVNGVINYEGRVAVAGVAFSGVAQMKFALVNPAGGPFLWQNSGSSGPGLEPTSAVAVTVSAGQFNVVLGNSALPNMAPLPLSVFSSGIGQIVTNPLFLRIWFNDGVNGSQLLTPDQRVTPVSFSLAATFAQQAATVPAGAITLSNLAPGVLNSSNLTGVLPPTLLPPGLASSASLLSVSNGFATQLLTLQQQLAGLTSQVAASNAALATNPALAPAVSLTAVSSNPADPGLLSLGYQPFYTISASPWMNGASTNQPGARNGQAAVWTGSQFFVWGGLLAQSMFANSGGIYDPVADRWQTVVPQQITLAGRFQHSIVWTGQSAIIWGGDTSAGVVNDGAVFNPAAQTWVRTATTGAPQPRAYHVAAWTGHLMVIWGGQDGKGSRFNDLSLYDPVADSWQTNVDSGSAAAPSTPLGVTGVWTGTELILWGSSTGGGSVAAAFTPAANNIGGKWKAISTVNAPSPRTGHSAVWTGSKMIVWGGQAYLGGAFLNDGAVYDPIADQWTTIPASASVVPLTHGSAVWTGQEMLVIGGYGLNLLASGSAYNPLTAVWRALTTAGNPVARYGSSAVWSGSEVLVFAGQGANMEPIDALQRLNPQPAWYFYREP